MQPAEVQSRKAVQMNSLVKNLIELFSDRCATVTKDFPMFVYNEVFFVKKDEVNLLQLKNLSQVHSRNALIMTGQL